MRRRLERIERLRWRMPAKTTRKRGFDEENGRPIPRLRNAPTGGGASAAPRSREPLDEKARRVVIVSAVRCKRDLRSRRGQASPDCRRQAAQI